MTISVFVLEDHDVTRKGIRLILEESPAIQVVGEAENVEAGLDLILSLRPDVVVSDFFFSQGKTGADLIFELQQAGYLVPVLILSGYDTPAYVEKAFMAGAKGYMLKDEYGPSLLTAVRQIAEGGSYFSPALDPIMRELKEVMAHLTDREWEVVRFVAQGLKNEEMAQILGIEGRTVRAHLEKVFKKLGLSRRGELIAWAWKNGYAER